MKFISLEKFIEEDERLPRGWGVVRVPVDQFGYIVAPIPLNVLLRWVHLAWLWLTFPAPRRTRRERIIARAKRHARHLGYAKGYSDGERHCKAAIDMALNTILNSMFDRETP